MQARMTDPAMIVPDPMQALLALGAAARASGVPGDTLDLVHLRASQLNGCGCRVGPPAGELRDSGVSAERAAAVAAWRESPHFTGAERAALALAEAVTRLSDRADPVPDAVWAEAARHYDEPALGALLLSVAIADLGHRIDGATRQGSRAAALPPAILPGLTPGRSAAPRPGPPAVPQRAAAREGDADR